MFRSLAQASTPRDRLPARAVGVVAAGFACTSALLVVSKTIESDEEAVGILLAVTQSIGVAWLCATGWHAERQWATAQVILAAAWALAFLLPSWLYALDQTLFDVMKDPTVTLAAVNLSLFSLLAGTLVSRTFSRSKEEPAGGLPGVTLGTWSPGWLWLATGVGLLGLALVFQGAGGPVEYLSNLNREGELNLGRTYVVWMALFLRYAAQIAVYRRWAAGEPLTWPLGLALAGAIAATALLGARLFVAVALVEIVLFYALVKRPLSLRTLLPVTATLTCVVILGGGAIKRYQDYQVRNPGPDKSLIDYLASDARSEATAAYANNYADGVRLLGLAQVTVPDYARFEYGKLFLRYALQPIPRAVRPTVSRAPAVRRAMHPGGGYSHAIPLQASAYMQLGLAGIVLAFGAVGLVVGRIDSELSRRRQRSFALLVVLTTLAVAIPSYLRSSDASGFATALIDVVGLALIAFAADGGPKRLLAHLHGGR